MMPAGHVVGALLHECGEAATAEAVYREVVVSVGQQKMEESRVCVCQVSEYECSCSLMFVGSSFSNCSMPPSTGRPVYVSRV